MNNIIYEVFEDFCYLGKYDDIRKFMNDFEIDVDKNDGFFLNIIAAHNNLDLFKLFIDCGADISVNNYYCVRMIAHCGHTNLLSYILNTFNISYDVFYNDTSLRNNAESYEIITQHFKK